MNFHPRPLVVLSLGVFGQHWKDSRKGGERKGTWSLRRRHRLWELDVKSRLWKSFVHLADNLLGNPDSRSQPFSYPWLFLLVPGECRLFDHCSKCHTLGSLSNRKVFSQFWRKVQVQDSGTTRPGFFWVFFFFTVEEAIFCLVTCLSACPPFFWRWGALKQGFSV